jgi:hypothetical protein
VTEPTSRYREIVCAGDGAETLVNRILSATGSGLLTRREAEVTAYVLREH